MWSGSPLVRCLNKLLVSKSRQVLVNGMEMSRKEVAKAISFILVRMEDLFAMSVFEVVLIGKTDKFKLRTGREDIEKVHRVLEALNLSELTDSLSNELSAEQCQTVSIVRDLVWETGILILNEPTPA